jgi:hypothetical protein
MTDKPTISMLEAKALEKARLLEQAAALDREMAEIAKIEELAAKYNLDLVPKTPTIATLDIKTLGDLIQIYTGSERYKNLTHASRVHYDTILGAIRAERGPELLARLGAEDFESWHAKWGESGKKTMAHSKIKLVRIVIGFGTEALRDRECERLIGVLSRLKFEAPKARSERLTKAQANDIRAMARRMERPSIALAQAFQMDVGLLQKDAIGEWVPFEEGGVSEYTSKGTKWVRGIRWSEIDGDVIFRHPGNGWQDDVEFDLRNAPSVLEELRLLWGFQIDKSSREILPISGAIIISEFDRLPWDAIEFRRWWRQVANACGIPKNVRNSDGRSRTKDNVQESDDEETERRLAL